MSNFWREIQNGLSDCKYWGISEKILRKEYFNIADPVNVRNEPQRGTYPQAIKVFFAQDLF